MWSQRDGSRGDFLMLQGIPETYILIKNRLSASCLSLPMKPISRGQGTKDDSKGSRMGLLVASNCRTEERPYWGGLASEIAILGRNTEALLQVLPTVRMVAWEMVM